MATTTPSPTPPTQQQAARFLAQAGFGGNVQSITEVVQLGYDGWLNKQINMPKSQSYKNWLIEKGFNLPGTNNTNKNSHGGWNQAVWSKLFTSPDVLRQRVMLAWSELFVVSAAGLPIGWRNFAIASYMDLLEANAFGNFRTLLEKVTLSSAMGTYLSMKNNKKADPSTGRVPDENYAREIMQLFTIGLYKLNQDGTLKVDSKGKPIDTYTNADIQGLAAVFTGWRLSSAVDPTGVLQGDAYRHGLPMELWSSEHTEAAKSFLGVTIPANTSGTQSLKIALDTLFNHANTAPFIAKHLIQRLVKSNPSKEYVGRVAKIFADNGKKVRGDLAAVIRAVLLDSEARTTVTSSTSGKLREPVIRLLQWGRTFGATSPDGLWALGFTNTDTTLGQMPMYSPSVFNFFRPGYAPPNADIARAGIVAPEFQIVSEPTVVGYINYMAGTINNARTAVQANYSAELTVAADANALVDRYSLWLAAGQLSATTLNTIKQAVGSINASTSAGQLNRIYATIVLIMSSTEYLIQK